MMDVNVLLASGNAVYCICSALSLASVWSGNMRIAAVCFLIGLVIDRALMISADIIEMSAADAGQDEP